MGEDVEGQGKGTFVVTVVDNGFLVTVDTNPRFNPQTGQQVVTRHVKVARDRVELGELFAEFVDRVSPFAIDGGTA